MIKTLVAALMVLTAGSASAGWFDALQGNDTGGIIPWSEGVEPAAMVMASNHCATYSKVAVITSIHRQYGDYIGFICVFPRDYDPVKYRSTQW